MAFFVGRRGRGAGSQGLKESGSEIHINMQRTNWFV